MNLLIDGNNFGMRAFGIVPLEWEGKRTEVSYVGLQMLRNYLEKFAPDRCVVVWDGGRDEYRKKLFPDYKRKHRQLTEEEEAKRDVFFDQVSTLTSVLRRIGFNQYRLRSREADDVIYSLVKVGNEYIVVSTDEDFFQLLALPNKKVKVYSPIRDILYTSELVEKKLGVPIEKFVEYKAIVGDPSDCLPGVRGLGPAKARLLFFGIEDLSPSENKVAQRAAVVLRANQTTFETMKSMIKFIDIPNEEMEAGCLKAEVMSVEARSSELHAICRELGFERSIASFDEFVRPFESYWKVAQ